MGIYNIHAGHNFKVPGAGGCFSETSEDRNVKNTVISYLGNMGHTVYDCTDEDGVTEGNNLLNIVNMCNSHDVDVDVSIHFNAFNGSAHGTEVWVYPGGGCDEVAQRIVNNLANLGFTNRGVKSSSELYVLNSTNAPALLVEVCFCDSETDASIYDCDKAARAIVQGLTGQTVSGGSAPSTTVPSTTNLYRIRKTWEDAKSQIGAYSKLEGAKAACIVGYTVFDWNGKAVYSNIPLVNTNAELYRVRKTWDDAKSQTGAYKIKEHAIEACGVGYSVFDWNGKSVYYNKEETVEPEAPNTDSPTIPEATDISPLKGVSQDIFLAVIGTKAKADMEKTGVLASVTIAQAILESSWGQSELSLKANNLFGMKASLSGNAWLSGWNGKRYTKSSPEDDGNGNITQVLSDFRAYDTIDKSIKDHSDYLCGATDGSARRYEGLKYELDYRKAITIIKNGGYATDSAYVDKICDLIELHNLTVYDRVSDPVDDPSYEKNMTESVSKIADILQKILEIIQKFLGAKG